MKVLYSPCFNEGKKITYSFSGEIITATFQGMSDTFDLSNFPEKGEFRGLETTLPYNPISYIERNNNILEVHLLNFISEDAPYEEKFPEWIEV